jgi:hypothetical protein
MLKKGLKQDVWLDLLCWESIVKIIHSFRGYEITVYYCQVSTMFLPLQKVFQRLTGISLIQINDFTSGDERINDNSAYEELQTKLKELLLNIENKWGNYKQINNFAKKNGFNIYKIKYHINEIANFFLYRPLEIGVIADIRTEQERHCFVFRRTPFSPILTEYFSSHTVLFYRMFFSQYFPVINRKDYFFDKYNSSIYFSSSLKMFFKISFRWIKTFLNIILLKVCPIGKTIECSSHTNIGVEQLHSRHRQDNNNDLFWFEDSQINPESIIVFETENMDVESKKILSRIGVKRVRANANPSLLVRKLFLKRKVERDSVYYVEADTAFLYKAIFSILNCWKYFFIWNETGWIALQLANYKFSTLYWLSIFKQLNIKIFWTMHDWDREKLIKAQALEKCNGIYTGSHWSNNPLLEFVSNKHFDVLFVWGPHFEKNMYNNFCYMGVFLTGYPSDHYFLKHATSSERIRAKYNGQFILSYQDNTVGNDTPCSVSMQINIHEMLLSLLEENKHMVLFLKPKRKYLFNKIVKGIPRICDFIKVGRIVAFFGETHRTKEVPAMVGMASDLVVGLGISTVAAECYFAGTLAFHADLTKFESNKFANQGLGKIVFRDMETLKRAIQECVDNGVSERYESAKKIYNMLDPFQDGQAYKRVGFVLKSLQDLLRQGCDREDTVKITQSRYKVFLKANFN